MSLGGCNQDDIERFKAEDAKALIEAINEHDTDEIDRLSSEGFIFDLNSPIAFDGVHYIPLEYTILTANIDMFLYLLLQKQVSAFVHTESNLNMLKVLEKSKQNLSSNPKLLESLSETFDAMQLYLEQRLNHLGAQRLDKIVERIMNEVQRKLLIAHQKNKLILVAFGETHGHYMTQRIYEQILPKLYQLGIKRLYVETSPGEEFEYEHCDAHSIAKKNGFDVLGVDFSPNEDAFKDFDLRNQEMAKNINRAKEPAALIVGGLHLNGINKYINNNKYETLFVNLTELNFDFIEKMSQKSDDGLNFLQNKDVCLQFSDIILHDALDIEKKYADKSKPKAETKAKETNQVNLSANRRKRKRRRGYA